MIIKTSIFTLIILVFTQLSLIAQVSFSCNYKEFCYWSEITEDFKDCEKIDYASLFVFNESETMFTHTTEDGKSTYYINDTEYNSEDEIWTYFVTSDVGNEYMFLVSPRNKKIAALSMDADDQKVIVTFYIKSIF